MKNAIRIPTSFEMLDMTIRVKDNDTLLMDDGASAKVLPDENLILIQTESKAYPIENQQRVHNFYHELMHLLFITGGYEEDYADERKVDLLAGLLFQALSTMRYKK